MSNNDNGGRSLRDGAAEPLPPTWGQSNSTRRIGRIGDWSGSSGSSGASRGGARIGSLRDFTSSGGPSMVPAAQGEDDDDDERGGENWFAGGERSGISVQNPDRSGLGGSLPGGNMVRDLLRRAAEAGPPPGQAQGAPSRVFTGGGYTLGADDVESAYIPDSSPSQRQEEPTIRHLTFWRDGFTVEDGELMRYDDPNNETVLAEINSGRAPPSILNVEPGEPVELRVAKRTDEDYVPPKRAAFFGSGNRLGAPVPEVGGSSSRSALDRSMPGTLPTSASSSSSSPNVEPTNVITKFEVDQSQPMTSVQIRLADGTRMVCRMNLTHTVLDLRNFINASRPENLTRPYSICTTFPNRTLDDNNMTIDAAGLKNSVVVQKWD